MEFYVGEIRLFAHDRIPAGWLECKGQSVSRTQYEELYSLLKSTFGSSGNFSFNLPNLQYRTIMGSSHSAIGKSGGAREVSLTVEQMPSHSHQLVLSSEYAGTQFPTDRCTLASFLDQPTIYGKRPPNAKADNLSIEDTGQSMPHNNMQPSLALVYCISTTGTYPVKP